MVGNSKVLTVSYGTFSCTLEGFDDSFDTMKAIAEYFRDLAAEDRYFGAEPPQPDAEVLARIAERELARGVHARAEGNAVLLKPSVAPEAAPAPAAAPAPVVEEAPAAEEAPVTEETPAVEAAPVAAPVEVAEEIAEEAVSEDVTEVVAEEAPAPVEEAEAEIEEVAEEEAPLEEAEADEVVADEADAEVEAPVVEEVVAEEAVAQESVEVAAEDEAVAEEAAEEEIAHEDETEEPAFEVEADEDESASEEATRAAVGAFFQNDDAAVADAVEEEDFVAEEDEPVEAVADDAAEEEDGSAATGLAAKLRRIQAVVGASRLTFKGPKDEGYTEDEHAEDVTAPSSILVKAADDAVEAADDAEEAEGEADLPRVLKMKREEFEAAMASAGIAQDNSSDEDAPEFTEATSGDIEDDADLMADDASDEDEDQADEMASILRKDDAVEAAAITEGAPVAESSLSAEDEADLMAELAAAEEEAKAEVAEAEAEARAEDDAEEIVAEASEEDHADEASKDDHADESSDETAVSFGDQESTMSRLMEEADAKMGEPESQTRRDAYSHLKAAVAAKQAARSMGEEEGSTAEKRENEYRADLAQVVRPRRAAKLGSGPRTSRPSAAPLKLVASQRVDAEEGDAATRAPAAPVRPRRIAAEETYAGNSAFAGFAESAGAEGLPDILEAAAAFVTHVEGNAVFSRPQMMRIVQQAMPEGSFSREDGLRAFGTLLRQGRINKIRGGQFEVTQSTRFQPEAREMREAG
ncbi:MAG: hypothetical protein MK180_01675 [Rhodobacteraceae bacterium]|nr:hypothetical protein [Paracoccaceae bacterium]